MRLEFWSSSLALIHMLCVHLSIGTNCLRKSHAELWNVLTQIRGELVIACKLVQRESRPAWWFFQIKCQHWNTLHVTSKHSATYVHPSLPLKVGPCSLMTHWFSFSSLPLYLFNCFYIPPSYIFLCKQSLWLSVPFAPVQPNHKNQWYKCRPEAVISELEHL